MNGKYIYYNVFFNSSCTASAGAITFSGKRDCNPLSPEIILQSNASASATYGASFSCGAFCNASCILSLNVARGISSISFFINENTSMKFSFEYCEHFSILSTLFPISKNKNSGAIHSNDPSKELSSKNNNGLPLVNKAEKTILVSTTSSILPHFFNILFTIAERTSSESRSTSSFVALEAATILSIFRTSSSLVETNLAKSICQFSSEMLLNSLLTSSGIRISTLAILVLDSFEYLKIMGVFEKQNQDPACPQEILLKAINTDTPSYWGEY